SDRLLVSLPSTWGCLDPRRCRPPRSVWCSSHDLFGPAHFTVCDSFSSRLRSGGVSSIVDASCHGCRFRCFAVWTRSVCVPSAVRVAEQRFVHAERGLNVCEALRRAGGEHPRRLG